MDRTPSEIAIAREVEMKYQSWIIAMHALQKLGLGIAAISLCGMAWAQGVIESVSGSVQSGTEVVRIDLSQPLTAAPAGFAIQSPARIASAW